MVVRTPIRFVSWKDLNYFDEEDNKKNCNRDLFFFFFLNSRIRHREKLCYDRDGEGDFILEKKKKIYFFPRNCNLTN